MPYVKCVVCGNEFYAKPFHQRKGWSKCCSFACRNIHQIKRKKVACFYCGKEVEKTPGEIRKSKSGKLFCDRVCQTKWRNTFLYCGENHANWKGGLFAYRRLLVKSGAPIKCKKCGESDERVLAVHHLDKNRKNNKVENLIWLCHNCHHLIHYYTKERDVFMETMV